MIPSIRGVWNLSEVVWMICPPPSPITTRGVLDSMTREPIQICHHMGPFENLPLYTHVNIGFDLSDPCPHGVSGL